MARLSEPRPVEPMSLAEARRMITDANYADGHDPMTRMFAWKMVHAHRRGQRLTLVLISTPSTEPPKDAA